MCGIFALLNSQQDVESIIPTIEMGNRRGPDKSSIIKEDDTNITLGFHRLAINGLDAKSDQPLDFEGCTLICNGEIYNYKQLYETLILIQSAIQIVKLSFIFIRNLVCLKQSSC